MSLVMPSASRVSKNNQERLFHEYEEMMIEYAKVNVNNDEDILNLLELDELDKVKNECNGYVTINHNVNPPEYHSYISCEDYKYRFHPL